MTLWEALPSKAFRPTRRGHSFLPVRLPRGHLPSNCLVTVIERWVQDFL